MKNNDPVQSNPIVSMSLGNFQAANLYYSYQIRRWLSSVVLDLRLFLFRG